MSELEISLRAELKAAHIEIELLKQKVDGLVRMLYRAKSEKLDPNQFLLLLEGLDSDNEEAPLPDIKSPEGTSKSPRKPRTKQSRPRIPEHLPVHEEVIDPEDVKASPRDWRLIGQEVTERLDYRPAQFSKHRLVRRKFVRMDAPFSPPVIAPSPPCLQERCLATPDLIAQVVVSKYVDHIPLYRQEQIYRTRHGVEIPRQTLCRWVELAAWWLEPLYKEMIRLQNTRPYLQIDETPIRYLQPGAGKCAQGYFWVTSVPGGDSIYHWYPGRGAKYLPQIINDNFNGSLQCDAYNAYASFQKQRAGPIELAGCWAHVRRKFFEALKLSPTVATWILRQIAQLYLIERRLHEQCAGAALRSAVRHCESAPIVRRIKKALIRVKPRYLPKNTMGKAINYALNNWTDLEVFLFKGMIEIDNNLVENAIRPTKLGAKNWLFIGSEESGKTSAIIFTLIESAKRHRLEPSAYLRELLKRLPQANIREIPQLTPEAIAKSKLKQKSIA